MKIQILTAFNNVNYKREIGFTDFMCQKELKNVEEQSSDKNNLNYSIYKIYEDWNNNDTPYYKDVIVNKQQIILNNKDKFLFEDELNKYIGIYYSSNEFGVEISIQNRCANNIFFCYDELIILGKVIRVV